MYPVNLQGPISPHITRQEINYGQSYMHQNISRQSYSPQQQFNQQYQYHQYPKQQYSFQNYDTNSYYDNQHVSRQQNLSQNNIHQSPTNIYQPQTSNYQNRVVGHQLPVRNQQLQQNTSYNGTNSRQVLRERSYSGSQTFQQGRSRNIPSPYSRPPEAKVVQSYFQQYHVQRPTNQRNDYTAENIYKTVPTRQNNSHSPSPSSPILNYVNYVKSGTGERTVLQDKLKKQNHLLEEQKNNQLISRNMNNITIEYQQPKVNPPTKNTLSRETMNTKILPTQLNLPNKKSMSFATTNQPLNNSEPSVIDSNVEYQKALEKIKRNEEKIKTLLERQQIDGKITDAKERIERLERIINLKERVSLNFINRFINATDAKIEEEHLCKPVIDAFDNIIRAGDNYKSFQIPHYDPFHELKEKFLSVPNFSDFKSLEDALTPYSLRKENEVKIGNGKFQNEVLQEIDERTKLIIGKDGKEHLIVLCRNEMYLVLSETITKDLKSCGKFKIDPQNIPISDNCREVRIIITFDKVGIPPLYLNIPVDYPKGTCSIISPNYNNEIRDISLDRLISRVEQALPCHSVYRRIQNIAITWMNLAMNV